MKKISKVLSLLLALLIAFTTVSIAFAAKEPEQTCPVILIPGFTSSDVYDNIEDPDTRVDFPSTDDIIDIVTQEFIPGLLNYAVDRDTDKLVVRVTSRINEIFAYWFNEPTGEAKKGSGIIPQKLTDVTATSRLTFSYDWRGDPVKIADELNEYIETVCKLSGCDKVAIGGHSLGTTIALSYLTKYGNKRVSALVLDSPACNGVALIGNVLTGKVNLDADGIAYYLKEILGENEYYALIASIVDIFKAAGVLELFTRFADEIIEALAPAVYRETVAPLLGGWPTLWSMLPDSDVEAAKAYIFGDILKSEDRSVLIGKLDNYNNTVRANRNKTLKSYNAVGKLAIISRYFSQTIPLRGSADLIGDTIIETKSTSFGATTAPIGEYFSDEYLKGKNAKYISPDKTVDASTCLFPEQTWFIRGSGHFETGGVTEIYYDMFFFSDKELTCDTAELGRFTYRDPETYTIIEDTAVPETASDPTLTESFYNFVLAVYETIKNLIKKVF